MSSRAFRLWSVLPVLGALVGVSACAGEDGASNAEAPAETAQELSAERDHAKPGAERGHRGHHGGPEMLLRVALHELDLSDAQEATIRGALEQLAAAKGDKGAGHDAVFAELARGVRAGKVDEAAVLAKAGGTEPGADAHEAAAASALQTLHATLTKEQRRALVTEIASHPGKGGRPHGRDHGPGAPGSPEGKDGERRGRGPRGDKGGPGFGGHGPLGFMLRDVDLTDAQREAIGRALEAQKPTAADHQSKEKQFEAARAEMQAKLETFAADGFDAKAFVARPAMPEGFGPKEHLQRLTRTVASIVPILEPAQREQLAVNLEKGPAMGPKGGKGRRAPVQ
jgi:Spy/CpxP family protein refolding chaperone